MGKSDKAGKSIKLFVEYNGLKLVYIAKKDLVVGRLLKKLAKVFYDVFGLDQEPSLQQVTENGFLVSLFDLVGEVFEHKTVIQVAGSPESQSREVTRDNHRSSRSSKGENSRDSRDSKDSKDLKEFKETRDFRDSRETKESGGAKENESKVREKELKEARFEPSSEKITETRKPVEKDQKNLKKTEEVKKEEKKSEKEPTKDHKNDSGRKKPKRSDSKEASKPKEEEKKVESFKKDPLKTSSDSDSDSDIFTKDEQKPLLSKSNIFRN